MLVGWSTDSYKNFFQVINSDASESSTKSVKNADIWPSAVNFEVTTLLLGGKTFPIIEAFFFLVLNSGPIQSSLSLRINTLYIPIHQVPTAALKDTAD